MKWESNSASVARISCFYIQTPNETRWNIMTPQEFSARLGELGVSLKAVDFPEVEFLHIAAEAIPDLHEQMVVDLLPRTVTIVGSRMTALDLPALEHFSQLERICAHRSEFAASLLANHRMFPRLRSIAMSHTSLDDSQVATLSGRAGIASLYFVATQLTDAALDCFATLPDLELLNLRETRITDQGLLKLTGLFNLFTIDARETSVTAAGARTYRERVKQWLPDVEVLL